MGNQLLRNFPSLGSSIDDYELLHQDIDRNLKFYQHLSSRKEIVVRQILIEKKYVMENMKQTFSNRQDKLKHPHLFEIYGTDTSIQPNNCNTIEKIVIMSEYSQRNLQDENQERSLQRRRYAQEEIWTILASSILAFSHLQKNNIRHECLKSSEIFISFDGIIKIKDPITTGTVPNLELLMRDRNSPHLYISPELCGSLQMSQPNHTYDPHKSDVFTLGMIILETGLLQYQDSCYKSGWTVIDWRTLQQSCNSFRNLYSSQLSDILVYCMLEKNPKTRRGWTQLQENIKIFDQKQVRSHIYNQLKLFHMNQKQNQFRQQQKFVQRQIEKIKQRQKEKQKSKYNSKIKITRQLPHQSYQLHHPSQVLSYNISPNISPTLSPEVLNRRGNYHHKKQVSNLQNVVLIHKSSSNSPTLHPFKVISRKNIIVRKPLQTAPIVKIQNSIKRRILQKSPKYQMKETIKFQSRQIVSPAAKKQNKLNKTLQFAQTRGFNRIK